MKFSPRERWMLVGLPGFLTAMVYLFGWVNPGSAETARLRKYLSTQGSIPDRVAAAQRAQKQRDTLARELDALKDSEAKGHAHRDPNEALQIISRVAPEVGLTLTNSAPDAASKLPPSLQGSAATLLWRLDFVGSYAGMVQLLDRLRDAKPLIVPLSVVMKTAPDERQPLTWTLSIWL